MLAMGLITVLVLGVAVMGVIAVIRDDPAPTPTASAATVVDVSLSEFSIDGDLTVPAGAVSLDVTNDGTMEHNVALVDPAVDG